MPTTNKILEGMNIINSYYANDTYAVQAEHDCIYMDPTNAPMCFSDLKKLVDIGWHQECMEEDNLSSTYNPEEPWKLYV